MTLKIFLLYLLIINAVGFTLMLVDKSRAKRNRWRIRESTLMTVAALGGGVGSLVGMYTVRHKTHHQKFTLGIPAIIIGEIVLWLLIHRKA